MLVAILAVLIVVVFLIVITWRISMCGGCGSGCFGQCETTTTTTTETTHDVKGRLNRHFDDGQPYVIDPIDGKKIWLNSTDDMYEDANGDIWALV